MVTKRIARKHHIDQTAADVCVAEDRLRARKCDTVKKLPTITAEYPEMKCISNGIHQRKYRHHQHQHHRTVDLDIVFLQEVENEQLSLPGFNVCSL